MYFLWWCHQESNRGHKDFQSFALPTELWHQNGYRQSFSLCNRRPLRNYCFLFSVAKVGIFFDSTNFLQIFYEILFDFKKMLYLCTRKTETECSAVGSALRSGRRGRAFESPHSDTVKDKRVYRNERCTPFFIMPYSNQLTEMKTYPRIMRKDYSRILARFQKVTFFPTIVVGILIQVLPDPAPSSVKSCAKFCLTTSLFQ